jgi:hypothetical protein
MNVPDLRNVDFDAYRQQAVELREQAMNESIDRAVAWFRSLLQPQTAAPVTRVGSRSAQCPA